MAIERRDVLRGHRLHPRHAALGVQRHAAGTVRLTDGNDANGGIYPSDLTAVGSTLYFSANDGRAFGGVGNGDQLWKSNGTAAGTAMVTDSNDGVANAGLFPYDLTAVGGTLYFVGPGHQRRRAALREQRHGGGHDHGGGHPGGQRLSRVLPGEPDGGGQPALLLGLRRRPRQPALDRRNGTASGTVQLTTGNASGGGVAAAVPGGGERHGVLRGIRPDRQVAVVVEQRDGDRDEAADHRQRVGRAG